MEENPLCQHCGSKYTTQVDAKQIGRSAVSGVAYRCTFWCETCKRHFTVEDYFEPDWRFT